MRTQYEIDILAGSSVVRNGSVYHIVLYVELLGLDLTGSKHLTEKFPTLTANTDQSVQTTKS